MARTALQDDSPATPSAPEMEPLHGPVLVATDLTRGAEEALRQGAQLATELGAGLKVCHVIPEAHGVGMLFPQWRGLGSDVVRSMTAKARSAVSLELASVIPGRDDAAEIVLDSGTAYVGILAQAVGTGAGVIVVGPGSVASQLVRHAPVPVMIARPSPPGGVMGATDFSEPSLRTLRTAAAEARRRGVPFHLVYVLDVDLFMSGKAPANAGPSLDGPSGLALDGLDEFQAGMERRLDDLLRTFGVDGQTAVLSGHADLEIVRYAERTGVALVVVGRHGRTGFGGLTFGRTASAVIDSAPCSVVE